MPRWIGAWSAAFPLRHYYMMFVQEAIYGSGFSGWWQEVVHFLLFLLLPAFGLRRLKSAYTLQNYPRN
jgi:ABC-2 type transport system permease protein